MSSALDVPNTIYQAGLLQGPTSNIGIFVDSGSVYETPENTGASHLLEQMGFKSTQNRTSFRVTREVNQIRIVTWSPGA